MRVTENSIVHVESWEKSVINIDRAAQSMWMEEFSVHPHVSGMRHACFSNSGTMCSAPYTHLK
jgi:hypothetical protein